MVRRETEDAVPLSPVRDDNETARHFIRRALPVLNRVDDIAVHRREIERTPRQ